MLERKEVFILIYLFIYFKIAFQLKKVQEIIMADFKGPWIYLNLQYYKYLNNYYLTTISKTVNYLRSFSFILRIPEFGGRMTKGSIHGICIWF
jgi:hypothetical protein